MEREFNLTPRQCEAILDLGGRNILGRILDPAALKELTAAGMIGVLPGNPRPVLTPRGQRAYRELMGLNGEKTG